MNPLMSIHARTLLGNRRLPRNRKRGGNQGFALPEMPVYLKWLIAIVIVIYLFFLN
jgi:hypothetical protein